MMCMSLRFFKNLFTNFLCAIACLLFCLPLAAQQDPVDSLNTVLRRSKHDTTTARVYVALTEYLYIPKPDTVIPLCQKALGIVEKDLPGANSQEKRSLLFTKAAALNNIAFIYNIRGEMQKAIDYFGQSLVINEEIGADKEAANALSNIGAIYDQQGQPDKALINYAKALKIQEKIGAKDGMAFTLNNMAAVYDKQGQVQKALELNHQSLKLHLETNNKYGAATCLNNLGALYVKQGDRSKALDYYKQSLKIREEIDDKQGIATCLHNIGYVYEAVGDRDKALDYDTRGLKIYESIGDKRGIANSYHNMAAIYEKQGDVEKALGYYNEALAIYESMDDKRGMANSLNNIGEALVKQSKPAKALPYIMRALASAKAGGYVEPIRTAYYTLTRIDSATGNMAGAYQHYKDYIRYRDSVSNVETRKAALKKKLQYEYETRETAARLEQDKKDAVRREELKKQKQINWLIAGAMVLAVILLLLLFNRYRLKQKNLLQQQLNQQQKAQASAVMETQEDERKRIAEDLHDSLGHLLSTVKLNLQTLPNGQTQVHNSLQLLNQASEEIRNITFNLMPRTLEEGGLVPALNELAAKVTNAGTVKVLLHVHDMDRFVLEKQSQFNIYRIVQEAVNNILKHAEASEINIQLIGQADHITIMIEDDGKGFDPGTNSKGRGLKNIVTRSLWLKGSLNIDSTPGRGTTITTEIPI